jgi:chromate transporter
MVDPQKCRGAGTLSLGLPDGNPPRLQIGFEFRAPSEGISVTQVNETSPRIGLPAIYWAFFQLGVTSFGGGTAGWLYREIVQRRHWIGEADFLSGAALGRLMPGSGGVNLTVQVGQRLRGAPGAVTAVLGLLSGPLIIVLTLAAGIGRIGQYATLHAVLDGVAAAAVGLTFATGLQLIRFNRASVGPLAMTFATVLCVGVLGWPMIPVVLCLAPISIGMALLDRRARSA